MVISQKRCFENGHIDDQDCNEPKKKLLSKWKRSTL